ncbi:SWI/SNF-related matrix-associated actin-dependent regulator of chromatin subfamily A containing DEAD/H box 1B [Dermacentor andersoni]|uniref:SWI/SNF-related matrix-associated actin-dependent regulator of chromatin subfamily A containing DEAD/H box 1B n=1 Tax=Dermacentor andersoni TaxID=34620 RepID=UPI00215589D7|nr:SWI/SNF-related matrix-associated actin-dependent regulator of chromatin subfamily A containing DEAD/H box 1B-like [Dermacentor andersoni]
MSDSIVANGAGSPSLLNTLRQFRFQKKCAQQSPGLEPCSSSSDQCQNERHDVHGSPERNEDDMVVPETPESALKRSGPDKSAEESPDIAASSSTADLEESPAVTNGVKRKRVLSSSSEDDAGNSSSGQHGLHAKKKTNQIEDDSSGEKDSEDECTRYMTDREKSLRQLIEEFRGADIMDLQDALVASKWNVVQARLYLVRNPPNRKACSPHRNARYKTVSSSSSKGVDFDGGEEREVTPKVKLQTYVATKTESAVKSSSATITESPVMSSSAAITESPVKSSNAGLSKFKAFNDLKSRSSYKKVAQRPAKALKIDDVSDEEEYCNEDIYGSADDSENSGEESNDTPAKIETKRAITEFFDNASFNELLAIPGCSRKKVEAVLENRPYETWKNLVYKFETCKNLTPTMLNSSKNLLHTRGVVNRLMARCQSISDQMQEIVSRLVRGESEDSDEYIKTQPSLLNQSLHLSPYQLIGLNWLAVMHKQEVNGILADEMGLGKTIQAIAFLAYLQQQGEASPHLVVVPSSTLENWMREFTLWCPSLDILVYHGSQKDRRELKYKILGGEVGNFDVLITTYNMISGNGEDRSLFKKVPFHYVIFDEAHMLKNMASQRYANLMKISAKRKILLTGTPLQNNLVELMSLLTFVMPNMFCKKADQIKLMFSAASKNEEEQSGFERDRIEHAKKIMRPFVLRRLKQDVLQQLPVKHEEERYCTMTPYQQTCYVNMVAALSKEFKETQEGQSGMLMKLRRASNHPLLLRNHYDLEKLKTMSRVLLKEPTYFDANPDLIFEDMEVMSDFELHMLCAKFPVLHEFRLDDDKILDSGKFIALDSLLKEHKEKNNRVLIFSQFTMMLDILEVYLNIRGHKWLRLDGSTSVADRQDLIDKFNEDDSILAFLLSTRAGGLGINLTSANVVIIHDLDFNPYNDKQAEDRCHRLGQSKEVFIIKLISKDTIDEGILAIAKDKLKLERDITDDTAKEDVDVASVAQILKAALSS